MEKTGRRSLERLDLSKEPNTEEISFVTEWLARSNYRVIRPLGKLASYCDAAPPKNVLKIAILDTETTGFNHDDDKIIELGILVVEVCPKTGQAFQITGRFDDFEDPGFPIPEDSFFVHHITDDMVSGKRINDCTVESLMSDVSLVIAHNADFDRKFVENRFPIFADKAWACSCDQVPWGEEGIASRKLEFLAYYYGFHYIGHRALNDCEALLEVLQQQLPDSGEKPLQALLQNAKSVDIKVTTLNSPFESKELLKERGYRWNADRKAWAKCVQKRSLARESAWLKHYVYGGKGFRLELEKMTAKNRFSNRPGETEILKVD